MTERRRVAAKLRSTAKRLGRNMDAHEFANYGADAIDPDNEIARWDEMTYRLADLIEPSCDRDAPQKVAEEMFGKMRHSTKEEADAYEAMLKSMSVEIHPVDREALLALADEIEAGFRLECSTGPAHMVVDLVNIEMGKLAHRIREACGTAFLTS